MKKKPNKISRALFKAKADKTPVDLQIRLKKNGRFSKASGQIHDIKISKDGEGYIVMENTLAQRKDGSKWQSVGLDYILSIESNGVKYRR